VQVRDLGIPVIRLALMQDAPAISACAAEAYAVYVDRMGQKPAPMLADYAQQTAAGVVHLACDAQGALEGFIVFYPQGRHMMLENEAVTAGAAGQGVGKALVRFCEAQARRLGCEAVRLYTNEAMTENLAIYPRLGYTEVGRGAEHGYNRVYFEKRLL